MCAVCHDASDVYGGHGESKASMARVRAREERGEGEEDDIDSCTHLHLYLHLPTSLMVRTLVVVGVMDLFASICAFDSPAEAL